MHLRALIALLIATGVAIADEHLPVLKVKDDVYSNVTVIAVSTTDIQFIHSRGIGNAKLKNLEPALQEHFNFDPSKAALSEIEQRQANTELAKQLKEAELVAAATKAELESKQIELTDSATNSDDFVAPQLHALSYRGSPPPKFEVQKWLTAEPDTEGKFVLIDFWATWCRPCRESIPALNLFHNMYGDRLVIIGVTDETEADVRKMTTPKIEYAIATDPQKRMEKTMKISGIPHCILIDPEGIVRYEGMPTYLDTQKLQHFLDKYK